MLRYSTLRYATLRYSTLLYSSVLYCTLPFATLLYASLLYSTLLYSTLCYSSLLCSTLLHSTLLYSTLLYSALLKFTLHYSTILYSTLTTLLYSTLLYLTLLYTTLPYSTLLLLLYSQPRSQGLSSYRLGRARRDPGWVWSHATLTIENTGEGSYVIRQFVALSFVALRPHFRLKFLIVSIPTFILRLDKAVSRFFTLVVMLLPSYPLNIYEGSVIFQLWTSSSAILFLK